MTVSPGMPSNPFEMLGLERSASFEDVKAAYRRLARQYHPDANPGDPTALDRFTALRRAYDRLKIFYQTVEPVSHQPSPATMTAVAEAGDRAQTGAEAQHESGASPAPPGTGDRSMVAEPSLPGTGSRRAFYRTGAARQSGEVVERGGTGSMSAPGAASRDYLPAPEVFGSGQLAARAELVRGQTGLAPGNDPYMFYALIGLRASETVVFPRIPLNLCLVLDHSSSMLRGGKVERLKETVRAIIEQLEEDDYLAVVTFGDRAEVLLPAQPLRNKTLIKGAIEAIHCRGGTEISRGLTAGLTELSRNASRAVSHLILLTDGQTRGDDMLCLERAEEAADLGVGITTYGLGTDWNNMLLDGIAAPTGGHSDYIESPDEMARAFHERVLNLQSTTLHRATLVVRPAKGHVLRRATLVAPMLRPLEPAEEQGAYASVLGDMSSNTDNRVLLEFKLGSRVIGTTAVANVTLSYDVPGLQREDETLTIPITTVIAPDREQQAPVDSRVAEAIRHMTIHRLQQQAWTELTNTGNLAKGTALLKRAAEHLQAIGHAKLAEVAANEASRVASGAPASDEGVKRIIYGTRRLG